uniref:UNC-50 family protein n=2 Tax=Oryza TaxID=4527 RepID=A0A0D3H3J1_9ORYZ
MLPTTASKGRGAARSAPPLFGPYLRRIVKWQQMDIEYTFWQMVHLCTSPKVVYGESPSHAALTITSVVLVHFLFAGIVLATLCWLYAFDVHCNSFFPAFVILYVILIGFNPTRYFLSLYFR